MNDGIVFRGRKAVERPTITGNDLGSAKRPFVRHAPFVDPVMRDNAGTQRATFSWAPGWVAPGESVMTTVTVKFGDVAPGDAVLVAPGTDLQGLTVTGYVPAPGRVAIVVANLSGLAVSLQASYWTVQVRKD